MTGRWRTLGSAEGGGGPSGLMVSFASCRSQSPDGLSAEGADQIYCYMVEQCLQAAQLNRVIFCPCHGNLGPYFIASNGGQVQAAHAAPDAVRSTLF